MRARKTGYEGRGESSPFGFGDGAGALCDVCKYDEFRGDGVMFLEVPKNTCPKARRRSRSR